MNELRQILETAAKATDPLLLATVVETEGTTYRHVGARLLLSQTGWYAGAISGGCLESDLLQTAWDQTAKGPAVATFDTRSPDDVFWGYGLGCPGVVHVLLERWRPEDACWRLAAECLHRRLPLQLATDLREGERMGRRAAIGNGQSLGDPDLLDAIQTGVAGEGVFLESFRAASRLLVFGAGHDALPLTRMAKEIGWVVTVVDPRSAYATRERFPRVDDLLVIPSSKAPSTVVLDEETYPVVMTHSYPQDLELLRWLLPSEVPYVGLLSSKGRVERLLGDLEQSAKPAKLHGPVGLDIGAEGPEEIALSILAEIQALRTRRA